MVQRRTVVLVCDLCGRESDGNQEVETRQVMVGRVGAEAEVCAPCWSDLLAAFAPMATAGRPLPLRTPRLRSVKGYPGTSWRFSSHALIRCGERNVDPTEVVRVIEDPTLVRPGRASDQEIRERGTLKAVVVPERGIVVTVARKGEGDELLADAI